MNTATLSNEAEGGHLVAPPPPLKRRAGSVKRAEQTVENILVATEQMILRSGTERISIRDVCEAAQVCRGTFYRYFASQEELLDVYSRHKREAFHRGLREATEGIADPDARFTAVVEHVGNFLDQRSTEQLMLVAPEFALDWLRRIFSDSKVRFQEILATVFDAWDARFGIQLDRELVCELLMRHVLSEQLVPGSGDRRTVLLRIASMVKALAMSSAMRR